LFIHFLIPHSLLCAEGIPEPSENITNEGSRNHNSATRCLNRVLQAILVTTNFSAAVDVDTVDRQSNPPQSTRSKEAWRFSRSGTTNTFTRTRFSPIPGREIIESTNFGGGLLLVGQSFVSLPADASLPGFEAMNMLAEMLAASPSLEHEEGGSFVLSATTPAGLVLKAWFTDKRLMPYRLIRLQGSNLLFVLTREEAGTVDSVLPMSDALHFYENGRVIATSVRSFSNVNQLSGKPQAAPVPTKVTP
jgi:hypothetical protein